MKTESHWNWDDLLHFALWIEVYRQSHENMDEIQSICQFLWKKISCQIQDFFKKKKHWRLVWKSANMQTIIEKKKNHDLLYDSFVTSLINWKKSEDRYTIDSSYYSKSIIISIGMIICENKSKSFFLYLIFHDEKYDRIFDKIRYIWKFLFLDVSISCDKVRMRWRYDLVFLLRCA